MKHPPRSRGRWYRVSRQLLAARRGELALRSRNRWGVAHPPCRAGETPWHIEVLLRVGAALLGSKRAGYSEAVLLQAVVFEKMRISGGCLVSHLLFAFNTF